MFFFRLSFSSIAHVCSFRDKIQIDLSFAFFVYSIVTEKNNSLDFISYKMTTTTTALLPRNKTGLYAGDTLQEVKVPRSHGSGIPVLRQAGTANGLLAPVEQDRMSKNAGPSSHSDADSKGIRNGFRPSVIRRQKARVKTAMTHHENRYRDLNDLLSNDILPSSPASARLKAEIDQLNSQLKIYGDLKKLLRVQNNPV